MKIHFSEQGGGGLMDDGIGRLRCSFPKRQSPAVLIARGSTEASSKEIVSRILDATFAGQTT